MFPQRYRKDFSRMGINVDPPVYGTWWSKPWHVRNATAYNNRWRTWFREHPHATSADALAFGRRLAREYKLTIYF